MESAQSHTGHPHYDLLVPQFPCSDLSAPIPAVPDASGWDNPGWWQLGAVLPLPLSLVPALQHPDSPHTDAILPIPLIHPLSPKWVCFPSADDGREALQAPAEGISLPEIVLSAG